MRGTCCIPVQTVGPVPEFFFFPSLWAASRDPVVFLSYTVQQNGSKLS